MPKANHLILPAGRSTIGRPESWPLSRDAARILARVATTSIPVLCVGSSGTAFARIAASVHRASGRSRLERIDLRGDGLGDLLALPRGRAADYLTLALDGIEHLDGDGQNLLASYLEDAAPRLLSATRTDLQTLAHGWREELLEQLATVTILAPALRERRDELPELARSRLALLCTELALETWPILGDDAEAALAAHDWPGDVTEFDAVLLATLLRDGLPSTIGAGDIEWHPLHRPRTAQASPRGSDPGSAPGGNPPHEPGNDEMRTPDTRRETDATHEQTIDEDLWMDPAAPDEISATAPHDRAASGISAAATIVDGADLWSDPAAIPDADASDEGDALWLDPVARDESGSPTSSRAGPVARIAPAASRSTDSSRQPTAAADPGDDLESLAVELAHQLKNPLVAIKTFVSRASRMDEEELGRFQALALEGIDRIDAPLDQLLEFSSLPNSTAETIEVSTALERAFDDYAQVLEDRGVTIQGLPSTALPARGARANLEFALSTLCRHVAESAQPQSSVSISRPSADQLVLRYGDSTGARHLRAVTAEPESGFPLALLLVRGALVRMGGSLRTSHARNEMTVELSFTPA